MRRRSFPKVDPPPSWTAEVCAGYFLWSYAVVHELKGVKAFFDANFETLFSSFGFDKLAPQELQAGLEQYYAHIASPVQAEIN